MRNQRRPSAELPAHPYQAQDRRGRASGRPLALKVALWVGGVLAACGLLVATAFGFLYAVNPMGDEWVCSDGEAPAGAHGAYNICYAEGSTLPPGVSWDPFGNRPMPYNCDKDGWVKVERPMPGRRGETEEDCVREGTELPAEWHVVDDD